MTARAKRIARVVDLQSGAVDRARSAVALAMQQVADLESRLVAAEDAWRRGITPPESGAMLTLSDLEESSARAEAFRRAADSLAKRLTDARAYEAEQRTALLEAQRELRKLELWRGRMEASHQAEASLAERKQADELAARRART